MNIPPEAEPREQDLVVTILRLLAPHVKPEVAAQIEKAARTEFGGKRVWIRSKSADDRRKAKRI